MRRVRETRNGRNRVQRRKWKMTQKKEKRQTSKDERLVKKREKE